MASKACLGVEDERNPSLRDLPPSFLSFTGFSILENSDIKFVE
jgi:hypothetical protein